MIRRRSNVESTVFGFKTRRDDVEADVDSTSEHDVDSTSEHDVGSTSDSDVISTPR